MKTASPMGWPHCRARQFIAMAQTDLSALARSDSGRHQAILCLRIAFGATATVGGKAHQRQATQHHRHRRGFRHGGDADVAAEAAAGGASDQAAHRQGVVAGGQAISTQRKHLGAAHGGLHAGPGAAIAAQGEAVEVQARDAVQGDRDHRRGHREGTGIAEREVLQEALAGGAGAKFRTEVRRRGRVVEGQRLRAVDLRCAGRGANAAKGRREQDAANEFLHDTPLSWI
ncbi:hypothetical protein Hsero_3113 [Herbaspirillum seropedicae SmR1]|uniref:Uncharacterized protein n=1 Tax=Herbaspirillum seropedicae (strain SmR1) TaxID=757424 RepID=D8J0P1_HERSS|nr:hypothetical protein Hsero_3113 [Herbaspirillum seropedicae SmR1]